MFKPMPVIHFQYIQFLVMKISALLCFLNVLGIAVSVFSYETTNSAITCIMTLPDGFLQNCIKFYEIMLMLGTLFNR